MKNRKLSHIQIIAIGYFCMIAIGTILLMLPVSTRAGVSTEPLTALFTATSASCVTGLILQDTATYWSLFGQITIICLIQIGGLGFMTIAIFFLKIVNKNTGLRERAVMAESINTTRMSGLSSLTRKIIAGTIIFEVSGAFFLSLRFVPRFGLLKGIYYGVFHSVSAFCNAGFDLMGAEKPFSSLTGYSDDIIVNSVIMLLIIIGGIGFLVWDDISSNGFKFKKYALHTKIVLVSSAILILSGALLIYIFEYNKLGSDMSQKEKILTSLFGSVTARTAGFNSTDTASLSPASKMTTMILMFIGGNSGSTAGGVKTTTVVIILLSVLFNMRGQNEINVFGRHVKDDALKKATVIVSINMILALSGAMVLCAFQDISVSDAMFETLSAIGTVGMTTGVTQNLNTISEIIIVFLMYCGRVGSISFATALFEKKVKPPISYPEEQVTIG